MARHNLSRRLATTTLGFLIAGSWGAQIALGQYTFVQDSDTTANWIDTANWNPNTSFPDGAGVTALINAPISTAVGTYQLTLPATVTLGELKIDNAGWANNYSVNFLPTSGSEIVFDSGTSAPARYIETAGTATSGAFRYTINQSIKLLSNWEITQQNVVYLNTGTIFSGVINGSDENLTITKEGDGGIQFNANLALLPDEGFVGKYVINGGGIRLIGTSAIAKSTGITVNPGGQLQLADNAGTVIADWNLASGAVLNLNGTGKNSVPGIATLDGALRIGLQANRTTTFHNPVVLQSDSTISVAATTTTGIIDSVISGPGGLTRHGAGTLVLSNPLNSYAGDTKMLSGSGTLSITNPFLADGGDVYLVTGSTLNLDYSGMDTIRSLYIDGVAQATGTWGDAGAAPDNPTTFITGTGLLLVTGMPGDYNGDGLVDGADYVLWRRDPDSFGGDPAGYDTWRANFSNPPASGATVETAAVPEPTAGLFAAFALCGLLAAASRRSIVR